MRWRLTPRRKRLVVRRITWDGDALDTCEIADVKAGDLFRLFMPDGKQQVDGTGHEVDYDCVLYAEQDAIRNPVTNEGYGVETTFGALEDVRGERVN